MCDALTQDTPVINSHHCDQTQIYWLDMSSLVSLLAASASWFVMQRVNATMFYSCGRILRGFYLTNSRFDQKIWPKALARDLIFDQYFWQLHPNLRNINTRFATESTTKSALITRDCKTCRLFSSHALFISISVTLFFVLFSKFRF